MPRSLEPIVDTFRSHLEDEDRDWERAPGIYYASEVWKCPARIWFDIQGFAPEGDLPLGIFQRGRTAEAFATAALRERYGDSLLTEVPVEIVIDDEIHVRGRADAVLVDRNLDVRRVWELKCKGKAPTAKWGPKDTHRAQLMHYIKGLQPREGAAVVEIDATDYLNVVEHEVAWDEGRWAEIERWWRQVHAQFKLDSPVADPKARFECHWAKDGEVRSRCEHYEACEANAGGPRYPVPDPS